MKKWKREEWDAFWFGFFFVGLGLIIMVLGKCE